MKITVIEDDGATRSAAEKKFFSAEYVVCTVACACGSYEVLGTGKNPVVTQRDAETDAKCVDCSKPRGRLRVDFDTIFGIEEDSKVIAGPWKVF